VCWIDTLLSHLKDKEQYVLLKKEEHRHIFTINAKRFFEYYLVTLTDVTEMSERSKMYEHDATYDPLTQIYNRNMFDMVMADLMKSRTNFSLILIDIDHFKVVNDTYGHLVGDEVLKMLTTLIKRHIREDDLFTRWGGEEFILSLKVGVTKAMQIAELLRTTIEKEHFSKVGTVHCSFGVTTRDAKSDLKTLFEKADKALYEAKNSGRNRVCQCL
jgi:diguanylate cyclase (GGDEF)-like protein